MNGKELPPNERIALLEQANAELKKSNVELEKNHAEEVARLKQEILRLQKQNPNFSTKTRAERLKKQDGI